MAKIFEVKNYVVASNIIVVDLIKEEKPITIKIKLELFEKFLKVHDKLYWDNTPINSYMTMYEYWQQLDTIVKHDIYEFIIVRMLDYSHFAREFSKAINAICIDHKASAL